MTIEVDMNTVSERLRYAMKKEDLSEYKLSEITGVKRPTIQNILRTGNNPRLDTVANICANLGLSIDWLVFGGTEEDMYVNRGWMDDLLSDEALQRRYASLADMKKYLLIRLEGDEKKSNEILKDIIATTRQEKT